VQIAGMAFHQFGGTPARTPLTVARPLVAAATVYFLLNTGLVATAIALSTRSSLVATWHNNFLWSAPSYFVGAGTAAVAAWLVGHAATGSRRSRSRRCVPHLSDLQGVWAHRRRAASRAADLRPAPRDDQALARAIDAKDRQGRCTSAACSSMQRAWPAVGLSESEIQAVKTAALLHDIGKLAVPEHILSKPGPLTTEEFQKIRIHPQVGAEIIAAVPFRIRWRRSSSATTSAGMGRATRSASPARRSRSVRAS
jgi:hypothetical protein